MGKQQWMLSFKKHFGGSSFHRNKLLLNNTFIVNLLARYWLNIIYSVNTDFWHTKSTAHHVEGLYQGDIIEDEDLEKLLHLPNRTRTKRNAVRARKRLWQSRIIPYKLTPDMSKHYNLRADKEAHKSTGGPNKAHVYTICKAMYWAWIIVNTFDRVSEWSCCGTW